MKNAKRVLISIGIGGVTEAVLFGLCWITSHDFYHEGPDTTLSVVFGHAAMWPGYLLSPVSISPHSKFTDFLILLFVFGLPTLIYGLFTYLLLRLRHTAPSTA